MGHGGIFISDQELSDIYEEHNRERGKLELRVEKLEESIINRISQSRVYPPGTFAARKDFEALQEQFDELFDQFKSLVLKCQEMALDLDLDFDKMGTGK